MAFNLTQAQRAQYDEFSMAEKIAILMIQLGDESLGEFFWHSDIESIIKVSNFITQMKGTNKAISAAVLNDFYTIFQSSQYITQGGFEYAKELLIRNLGEEEGKKVLEKLSKSMQETKNFAYLSKVSPQQLADFIINEHPQIIALILAHMDPNSAAETLSYFSDAKRAEVSNKMASLGAEQMIETEDKNDENEPQKRIKNQLELFDFREDELKYEVLLEKVKTLFAEKPQEFSNLFQMLIHDETGLEDATKKGV